MRETIKMVDRFVSRTKSRTNASGYSPFQGDGQNVGELYIFFEKMLAFQIVRILDKTYIEYMHIITE